MIRLYNYIRDQYLVIYCYNNNNIVNYSRLGINNMKYIKIILWNTDFPYMYNVYSTPSDAD